LKKDQLSPATLAVILYSFPANNDFSTFALNLDVSVNLIFSGLIK
tara:strand:+ start:223 stop:357 length:135 start_codon:yes stop_codon:yes gene_type:complete